MTMSTTDEPKGPVRPTVIPFPRTDANAGLSEPSADVSDAPMAAGADDVPRGEQGLTEELESIPTARGGPDSGHSGAVGPRPAEVFWNLPNSVTVLRMSAVPIFLFMPMAMTPTGSRIMAWAFIVAAVTDILDGWLARRDNGRDITRIGKLLDPLADKLLISTALIMLLAVGRIPLWGAFMVVVIVGRELAVTGLRGIASSEGHVVAATGPGKLKTVAQSIATGALLFHYETLGLPAHEIGLTLLAIATALTLWSGYLYFADYFGWRRAA